MQTTDSRPWRSYGLAAATVALAVLIKTITDFAFGGGPPLILFLSAVMVTARFAGRGPGLVATALSALVCDYFYFPPGGSIKIHSLNDGFRLSVFVLEGLALTVLMGSLHAARRRAEEQQRIEDWIAAVTLGLTRACTLADLCRHCTEAMVEHLDAALARIWTLNDAGNAVVLQASSGLHTYIDGPHRRIPLGAGRSKIGMIAAERRPHLTNGVIGDPQVPNQEWAHREGLVAFAGYPLIVEDRLVGVMAMFARRPLTEVTVQALASVANSVALGVRRKRVEQELKDSEKRLRLVIDGATDYAIIMLDVDGRIASWNAGAERIKGYRADEVLGQHLSRFYPPEDVRAGKPDRQLRAAESEGRLEDAGWRVRKDGLWFWASAIITAVRDDAGRLVGFANITRDITAQKMIEESRDRLAAILEATTDFVGIADASGRALYLNGAGRRMIGIGEAEEITRTSIPDYLPAWASEIVATVGIPTACREGAWSGELAMLRRDGCEIPVSMVILVHKDAHGDVQYLSTITRDITERRRVEDAMRRTNDKLEEQVRERERAYTAMQVEIAERKRVEAQLNSLLLERQIIFDTIPDILYVLDSDGCLVRWNRKLELLTGFSPEELKGKYALDFFRHDERDAVAEAIRLAWTTGYSEAEFDLVRKDGTACPIQWTCVPLENAKGDRIGLTGMGRDVTEQRRAAETLRKSEARLAEAQQIAQVGSWEWNPNTNEVFWSDELYRILGEEPGVYKPTFDGFNDRIYIRDRQRSLDAVNECLASKSRLDCCFRIVRRDGSIRVGRSRGEVAVDGEGRPVRMVGTFQDITDAKRVEEELQAAKQVAQEASRAQSEFLANMNQEIRQAHKLALIASRTHNAVILTDPQGRIEWINDGFSRITEYTLDEVIGRTPGSVLQGPETDCATREHMGAQIHKGEGFHVETVNYAKSGRKYWAALEVEPIHDASGRLIHFMAIEADVTERKQAEQDRDRLATIVESSDDAIIGMDLEGVVTSWNAGAERIFGYQAAEAVGRSIRFLSPPERAHADASLLEKLRLGERVEPYESVHVAKDGRSIDVSLRMSPIKDHSGQIVGVSKIARDVTEFKKQAESLLRAKKLAEEANHAKSRFLANMSHEIRTPMTAVIGFADLLRRGVDDEAERHDCIDTIVSSGNHVLTLLSDILDLSKIEAGRMEFKRIRCSPHQVVSDVLSILRIHAAAKMLSLEYAWEGRAPKSIETDPDHFRQLLMNLVGNAIKFTDRGAVRVVAAVDFDQPEPRMVIEVHDTGIGIAPENLDRIFSPFDQADVSVTRRFGGTGLGLTISRHIARGLGGELTVESRLGEGSVFRATIPTGPLNGVLIEERPSTEALASHDLSGAPTTHLNGARILLVEDGATNRKLISLVLRRAGAEVVCAVDGQAGLKAATEQPFDLILMDMQMPVLDGYEATRRLRAAGCVGPILALTAHALRGDAEVCLACGCDDHLVKPIEHDRLLNAVAEHMKKAAPARAFALSPPSVASGRPSELTSALPTDDPEFREIIEEFLVTLDERLRAMRAAWHCEEREELARLAHWLKGAGGTAGFDAFTEPARRLEQQAKHGPKDDAGHALREVEILAGRIVMPSQLTAEVEIATCQT